MELIPKILVVGLFSPPLPGITTVTREKLNLTWSEITSTYSYRGLEFAPDGTAAQFHGASEGDGIQIALPLIQVSDEIQLGGASRSADKATSIVKTIARNLGLQQFFNLGIKLVYWAPAPAGDGAGFVAREILQKSADDLGALAAADRGVWAGIKVVSTVPGVVEMFPGAYTLQIEPLVADMSMIYMELDAQFPGPFHDLDAIAERSQAAEEYLSQTVNGYLDSLQDGGEQ
jgi:hypothetical protein